MKKILILVFIFLTFNSIASNKKRKQDIEAIKGMCGCMNIRFEFAETISPNKDYEFYKNYISGGTELAFVEEESDNRIVIQHLLVVGEDMVIKHWRQDWIYEGDEMYQYDKDQKWIKKKLTKKEAKGKWIQKVYQVDDSPRYEGIGSWVYVDGKTYWESTTDAPLPRREYSKRKDYNVMERGNRHEIKSFGWVHEQDNRKISRGDEDILIAEEKGWNTYRRVDDEKCKPATDWWVKNKNYWKHVRSVWDEYYSNNDVVSLHSSIDKRPMFSGFFELGGKVEGNTKSEIEEEKELVSQIKEIINKYSKD